MLHRPSSGFRLASATVLVVSLVVAVSSAGAVWVLGRHLPAAVAVGMLVLSGFLLVWWMMRPQARLLQASERRYAAIDLGNAPPFRQFVDALAKELEDAGRPKLLRRSDDQLLRVAGNTQQLKRVIDSLPVGVAIADASFNVLYVNDTYTRLLGWTTADVQGSKAAEVLLDDQSRAGFLRQFDLLADPPGEMAARFDACCRDGSRLPVQWHMVPLFDRRKRFDGIITVVQDRSAEVQARLAELQLVESEARLAAVIASASDAIVSTDIDGSVLLFNPAAERIFRTSAADMMGQPLDRLLPLAARETHTTQMTAFAESKVSRRAMGIGRVQGIRADGQSIDLEAAISQAEVQGRTVMTAILRDITDRLRADRALINYQIQLAGLSHRLLAQEKETTRRLAQALHDDLGQTLAAMRLVHDAGMRKSGLDDAGTAWMQRIGSLINDANRQVRRVLIELRPPLLDDAGLHAALDNELQQQQGTHEDVDLHLDWGDLPTEMRWPGDVEHAVFMIAREAIGNALHHAAPHSVTVRVRGTVGKLVLSVADDGCGEPHIEKIVRPGHLGLVGMRERALAIGAVLEIRSSQSDGTTVDVTWEVNDASFVPD